MAAIETKISIFQASRSASFQSVFAYSRMLITICPEDNSTDTPVPLYCWFFQPKKDKGSWWNVA